MIEEPHAVAERTVPIGALQLEGGERPAREHEELPPDVRATERLMLGLRLDEPLALAGVAGALDEVELARLTAAGLAARDGVAVTLTPRGRFLGGAVTARLLA